MNTCRHIGWFYLSGRESFHLHYGTRTANVIHEMASPDQQYPSMIFFIGKQSKDTALREIFPNNNIRRGDHDGIVNLRLDSSTFSSDTPLLFADGDPQTHIPSRLGGTTCHECKTLPLAWPATKDQSVLHSVYTRLVGLFSDVVCIFAEDLDGLDGVATFLSGWIEKGDASTLPMSVRPRVIIVVCEEEAAATHSVLQIENLRLKLQDHEARAKAFSSISLIHLAGEHISPLARHRRLKEVLLAEVEISRVERIEQRVHFSAVHFEAFFSRAIHHLATSIDQPFDYIESTRLQNNVQGDYSDHIATFMALSMDVFISYGSLTSFIASSILMDAYPPRMHGKTVTPRYLSSANALVAFNPRHVFQRLYKAHCFRALVQVLNSPMFAEDLCIGIEDHMEMLFQAIDLGFETSVQVHTNNIKSFSSQWTQIYSHKTCLFCLRRRPEHVITCEHAICDVCVAIFGQPIAGKECQFEIDGCILCLTRGKLVARLKPATAGARILSVDGGGVRGVVPLEFLRLLQGYLGSELQVQDLFEQAFGTSSGRWKCFPANDDDLSHILGGLIVLGLFIKHWDVSRCARTFDILIRDFFGIHMTKGTGLLTQLRDCFRCWLSDGCYDVDLLETSLKDIFGNNRRLFDADRDGISGQKVAVTATTLSDASTYIFSNYNGKPRGRGCGTYLAGIRSSTR